MLAIGSALAIVIGFILAAMIEREKVAEGFLRTAFLYPLAIHANRPSIGTPIWSDAVDGLGSRRDRVARSRTHVWTGSALQEL